MTPEAKVKNSINEILKNIYNIKPVVGYGFITGTPDIICCVKGLFVGIEVKSNLASSKPKPPQIRQLRDIERSGGAGIVIDETGLDMLQQWLKQPVKGLFVLSNAKCKDKIFLEKEKWECPAVKIM